MGRNEIQDAIDAIGQMTKALDEAGQKYVVGLVREGDFRLVARAVSALDDVRDVLEESLPILQEFLKECRD